MTENFPKLAKEKVTQVQELHRIPVKTNPKRPTPKHITIKWAKFNDKERILKAAGQKQVAYLQGSSKAVS